MTDHANEIPAEPKAKRPNPSDPSVPLVDREEKVARAIHEADPSLNSAWGEWASEVSAARQKASAALAVLDEDDEKGKGETADEALARLEVADANPEARFEVEKVEWLDGHTGIKHDLEGGFNESCVPTSAYQKLLDDRNNLVAQAEELITGLKDARAGIQLLHETFDVYRSVANSEGGAGR